MNNKTLLGLAAAALVALLVAVLLNYSNKPLNETTEQIRYLLPGLREHVNEVSQITLTGADNKPVATLKRGDVGWAVAEKSGYPADLTKVREFLLKLADATLIEQKTSNKDRYAELGVEDVVDKDAKGVLVELAGLAQPVRLIVGNYNGGGGGGTFVRLPTEKQSWLAKGNIAVEKSAPNWLRHELTDVQAARFREVVLTAPDGKILKAAKAAPGDVNYKLADVPKGRGPSSDFAANGLVSTLAGLRFDDVLPARDAEPGDKVYKAHYVAYDGLVVDVQAWEKDGKDYARFTATLDAAAAESQIKTDQAVAKTQFEAKQFDAKQARPDANDKATADTKLDAAKSAPDLTPPLAISDPAKDHADRLALIIREIADLNKLFDGWSFVLPVYKFANINKSMDEMLKPLDDGKGKPDPKNPGKKLNTLVGPGATMPGGKQ